MCRQIFDKKKCVDKSLDVKLFVYIYLYRLPKWSYGNQYPFLFVEK